MEPPVPFWSGRCVGRLRGNYWPDFRHPSRSLLPKQHESRSRGAMLISASLSPPIPRDRDAGTWGSNHTKQGWRTACAPIALLPRGATRTFGSSAGAFAASEPETWIEAVSPSTKRGCGGRIACLEAGDSKCLRERCHSRTVRRDSCFR